MTVTEGPTTRSQTTATDTANAKTAARPQPVPFEPGSILWEQIGLYSSALGGNCAFILQVMHPSIGTVVDQKSSFRVDPVGRAARSFASVQTWVYGGQAAIEEGDRLRRMHASINAVDDEGRTHHALSAEPWAWVHLTGFYAAVVAARYFGPQPMTPDEEQQVFDEFMQLGRILRVPERMLPATIPDYWAYFDDMVANTLVDHRVAHDVLNMMDRVPPGTPAPLRPLLAPASLVSGRIGRFVTIGTLPPVAREKLGLSWSDADDRRLRMLGQVIARSTARLPERIRYMPIAYRARQAARARERFEKTLAERPM
jgi:uncharacterized protein (DUF2236 family)